MLETRRAGQHPYVKGIHTGSEPEKTICGLRFRVVRGEDNLSERSTHHLSVMINPYHIRHET